MAPSHYLNQQEPILLLETNLKSTLNKNTHIFIQENAFESIICKRAAILFSRHCVKPFCHVANLFTPSSAFTTPGMPHVQGDMLTPVITLWVEAKWLTQVAVNSQTPITCNLDV